MKIKKTPVNESLNLLKGIACIMVVFMHARFPGLLGKIIIGSRFAVPVFFMISGYFTYGSQSVLVQQIPRKAAHIGKICVIGYLYNFFCEFCFAFIENQNGIAEWIKNYFNVKDILRWVFLNHPLSGAPLWFCFALLYCYLAFYVVVKAKIEHPVYKISFLFLAIGMVQNRFPIFHMDGIGVEMFDLHLNWLVFGFPFFIIGNLIHKYTINEASIFDRSKGEWIIVLSTLMAILESVFTRLYDIPLFTPLLAVALFSYALNHPRCQKLKFLQEIGQKYSLFIYIIHWSVFKAFAAIAGRVELLTGSIIYAYFQPILVLSVTLAGAVVFDWMKNWLIHFFYVIDYNDPRK